MTQAIMAGNQRQVAARCALYCSELVEACGTWSPIGGERPVGVVFCQNFANCWLVDVLI